MQVEIIEKKTRRPVATYPVDLTNRAEPPAHSECAANAWSRAVAEGLVDPQKKAEYDILVGVSFGYNPDNDVWPMTLLMGARSSAAAADATVRALGPLAASHPVYLTTLFLLGQSIETSLKAYLCLRGFNETQLVRAGHNLPGVLRLAAKFGFPKPHAADLRLLELLNTTYSGQRKLQYHRASAMTFPMLAPTRELAAEYIVHSHKFMAGPVSLLADRSPDAYGLYIDPNAKYGGPTLTEHRANARVMDLKSIPTQ